MFTKKKVYNENRSQSKRGREQKNIDRELKRIKISEREHIEQRQNKRENQKEQNKEKKKHKRQQIQKECNKREQKRSEKTKRGEQNRKQKK